MIDLAFILMGIDLAIALGMILWLLFKNGEFDDDEDWW